MARNKARKYASFKDEIEHGDVNRASGSTFYRKPPDVHIFKPEDDTYRLVILPYEVGKFNPNAKEGSLYWKREFWGYRRLGAAGEDVVSPQEFGKRNDPVMERRRELVDEDDPSLNDEIRSLTASKRMLMNVIDLDDKEKGVQIWEISVHCFGKLLRTRCKSDKHDRGWGDFYHLEGGFNLEVTFDYESLGKNQYLKASTIDFIPRKKDIPESYLDKTHCLDGLLIETSAKRIVSILDGEEDEPQEPKETDDDSDAGEEDFAPSPSKKSRRTKKETEPDPDDALDDDGLGDEEEEEETPKPKRKRRTKKEPEPDPDDELEEEPDPDDELGDEEEEEETPKPKRGRGRPRGSTAKKTSTRKRAKKPDPEPDPDDDDGDDDGLDLEDLD